MADTSMLLLGGKLGDLVEVRRGLAVEQTVVLEPGEALEDGGAVAEKKA